MRISRKRYYNKKFDQGKQYRVNQFIMSSDVRLIDENGQNVGVVSTAHALEMARSKELDLVEVSPLAQPPVAKILNFNKFKYEEDKNRRKEKAKHKIVEIKSIRLSLRIGENDLQTKIRQAQGFLEDNNKVKLELFLKGREKQRKDLARQIMQKFIDELNQLVPIRLEQEIKSQGDQVTSLFAKKS